MQSAASVGPPGADLDRDGRPNVDIRAERGEYVVRAEAVEKYLPLIEAINLDDEDRIRQLALLLTRG